jgi:hypothetical protein
MFRFASLLVFGALVSCSPNRIASKEPTAELLPPVRLEAAGKPIDTDNGHAAPFVGDYFGTGKQDLLVGQFGEGLLTIYRNEGTRAAPKYAAGVSFKGDAKGGRVPSG